MMTEIYKLVEVMTEGSSHLSVSYFYLVLLTPTTKTYLPRKNLRLLLLLLLLSLASVIILLNSFFSSLSLADEVSQANHKGVVVTILASYLLTVWLIACLPDD